MFAARRRSYRVCFVFRVLEVYIVAFLPGSESTLTSGLRGEDDGGCEFILLSVSAQLINFYV